MPDFQALKAQLVFKRGDINGAINLFFDNLATLISIIAIMTFVIFSNDDLAVRKDDPNFGAEVASIVGETVEDVIFVRTLPGLAVTMVFGNLYYSFMGARLGANEDRAPGSTCALPYGVNTPAAFAFLFGVIGPGFAGAAASCQNLPMATLEEAQLVGECYSNAVESGWSAGVVANFMVGIISVALGFLGPVLLKVTPVSALLVSLAGIGFAFLGINQVYHNFQDPVSGLLPLFMTFAFYFGNVDLGILPKSLVVVVIGTALAWIDGVQTIENLENAADLVKPYGLSTGFSAFDSFSTLSDTIGTVLPVAFAAASGTLMNVISAKKAGDSYGPVETMVSDGMGTIIAAFFGTPFGTSVYIGHPAYKKMGAGIAYSIVNCVVYFFFAIFGVFSVCAGLIPQLAVAPLLLFVGLTITQEAFESGPVRHYPGIVFGLIPSVVDLMITKSADVPYGFVALQPAAILLSMVFAAIAIYCTDRKFLAAAGWSVGASILSFIGLLHQQYGATLEEFKAAPFNGTEANTPWRYSVAWLTVAGFMMIIFALQKVGKVEPEIEDEEVDQELSAKVDAY